MERQDPTNAADRVYRALRSAIVAREFLPGDALSRASLAKAHDTSQTPVREALLRLDREGLVRVKPQSGTRVAPIDATAVHQAHFLRRSLEETVVRRLAARSDMSDLSDPVHTLAPNAEMQDMQAADHQFHAGLFERVGMTGLLDAVTPLLLPLERCGALRGMDPARVALVARDHADILDRINARDPEGAARAMAAHLSSEIEDLSTLQHSHPDMFA